MEVIRDLVQTLIIIVILAVFLEMLLPRGDFNPYVRMVMGLLIIIAVLNAISGIMNQNWFDDLPDVQAGSGPDSPSIEEIISAGESMREENQNLARDKYREGISNQIKALARINADVEVEDVIVDLSPRTKEQRSRNIEKITLVISPYNGDAEGEEDSQDIPPVEIDINESEEGKKEKDTADNKEVSPGVKNSGRELAGTIADFYNLPREKVIIKYT